MAGPRDGSVGVRSELGGWRAADAPATRRVVRRRRWVRVGAAIAGTASVGAGIALLALGDPGRAGIPWPLLVVAGAGTLATVGLGWWRSARLHGVLVANPWVVAQSRVVELALGGIGRRVVLRMLELTGAPDEGTVLVAPVALRAQVLDHLTPQVWIAGSDRRFVAAAPGGGRLMWMRRVRLTGDARPSPQIPLRSRLDTGE